jgi:hypothetical protein
LVSLAAMSSATSSLPPPANSWRLTRTRKRTQPRRNDHQQARVWSKTSKRHQSVRHKQANAHLGRPRPLEESPVQVVRWCGGRRSCRVRTPPQCGHAPRLQPTARRLTRSNGSRTCCEPRSPDTDASRETPTPCPTWCHKQSARPRWPRSKLPLLVNARPLFHAPFRPPPNSGSRRTLQSSMPAASTRCKVPLASPKSICPSAVKAQHSGLLAERICVASELRMWSSSPTSGDRARLRQGQLESAEDSKEWRTVLRPRSQRHECSSLVAIRSIDLNAPRGKARPLLEARANTPARGLATSPSNPLLARSQQPGATSQHHPSHLTLSVGQRLPFEDCADSGCSSGPGRKGPKVAQVYVGGARQESWHRS